MLHRLEGIRLVAPAGDNLVVMKPAESCKQSLICAELCMHDYSGWVAHMVFWGASAWHACVSVLCVQHPLHNSRCMSVQVAHYWRLAVALLCERAVAVHSVISPQLKSRRMSVWVAHYWRGALLLQVAGHFHTHRNLLSQPESRVSMLRRACLRLAGCSVCR